MKSLIKKNRPAEIKHREKNSYKKEHISMFREIILLYLF